MVSWTRALKPLVGSPATSWVAALLDFVGHARQMFADRPTRCAARVSLHRYCGGGRYVSFEGTSFDLRAALRFARGAACSGMALPMPRTAGEIGAAVLLSPRIQEHWHFVAITERASARNWNLSQC
jgi:hypothetical protein